MDKEQSNAAVNAGIDTMVKSVTNLVEQCIRQRITQFVEVIGDSLTNTKEQKMIPVIEDIVDGLLSGHYTREEAIHWLNLHAGRDEEGQQDGNN